MDKNRMAGTAIWDAGIATLPCCATMLPVSLAFLSTDPSDYVQYFFSILKENI